MAGRSKARAPYISSIPQSLLDRIPQPAFLFDEHGGIAFLNASAYRTLGWEPGSLVGHPADHLLLSLPAKEWARRSRELTEAAPVEEHLFQHASGSRVSLAVELSLHTSDGGALLALVAQESGRPGATVSAERGVPINGSGDSVTDRVTEQAALYASEEHYRDLFNHLPESVILLEITDAARFRVIDINPAFAHSLDRPREHLIGCDLEAILPGEELEASMACYSRCVTTGEGIEEEFKAERADGPAWIRVAAMPLRNASGQVHRVVAVPRDITAEKRMEVTLRRREREFRTLAEHLPELIKRHDASGVVTYVNPMFCRHLGVRREEVVGVNIREVDVPGIEAYRAAVLSGSVDTPIEFKLTVFPNGERRIHHLRVVTERDEHGAFIGTLTIGRDVTESETAADRLHEQAETFRALVENLPQAIIRYAPDTTRLYVNPVAARLIGRPADEIVGTPYDDTSPIAASVDVPRLIREVVETGVERHAEIGGPFLGESVHWAHLRFVPELGADGQVTSVLVIGTNITDLKLNELKFRSLAENLPDCVIRYDVHGRIVYMNSSLEGTLGVKLADVHGKRIRDALPAFPDAEAHQEIVDGTIAPGTHLSLKIKTPKPDGGERMWEIRFVTEFDENGFKVGTLAIGTDRTESERAAVVLHERAELFRALVENTPNAIVRYGVDGRALYVNAAAQSLFAGQAPEPGGFPAGWGVSRLISRVVASDRDQEIDVSGHTSAGEPRWWHLRLAGERDTQGHVTSVLAIATDVTSLKLSELQYQSLAANLPVNVIRYDVDGKVKYMNPALETLLGVTLEAAIGKPPSEAFPDFPFGRVFEEQIARSSAQPVDRRFTMVSPQGVEHHVITFVTEWKAGVKTGTLAIGRDITHEQQMAALVHERAESFRALVENSPDFIVRFDREGKPIYTNPAFRAAVGSEWPGGGLERGIDAVEFAAAIRAVFARGDEAQREVAMRGQEGQAIWTDMRIVPEFAPNGTVESVLSIGRDITDRKRLDEALRRSEREFRTLVENLPINVVRMDAKGRTIYANQACCDSLGVTREEALSWDISKEALPGWERYVELALMGTPTDAAEEVKLWVRRPDGGRRYHLLRIVTERDEQGTMIGTIAIGSDITDAERSARALHDQAESFRALVENSPDLVVRYDTDGKCTYANPAARALFGQAQVGRNVADNSPVRDTRKYGWMIRAVVEHGQEMQHEWELRALAGRIVWAHIRMVPEFAPDGTVVSVLAIGRDMTERKRLDEALRRREREFRTLVENLPTSIMRIDAKGDVIYVNQAACESLGVSREEILSWDLATLPADWTRLGEIVRAGTRTEAPEELKGWWRRPDGQLRRHLLRLVSERDADGALVGTVAFGLDVTDAENAALALHERAESFRALVENSPDMVVRYDRSGRRLYANPAMLTLIGRAPQEFVGKTVKEYTPAVDGAAFAVWVQRACEWGEEIQTEVSLRDHEGNIRWADARLIPEFSPAREVVSVLFIGRDITERRRMELMLRHREAEFRSLAESVPDLIVRYDGEGRVSYVNQPFLTAFGLEASAVVGKQVQDCRTEDFIKALVTGEGTDTPQELKLTFQTAAGDTQTHLIRVVTERDKSGAKVGTLTIGRDITAMERASQLLHERAESFRALVENSPDAIVRYGRHGNLTYANPAMQALVGHAAADLLGSTVDWHSELLDAGQLTSLVQGVIASGEELLAELALRDVTGGVHWYDLRVVPEFAPDGEVVSVMSVGRDISGRREVERRLEESRAELRKLAASREVAREEERKHLARELHDELGQLLMALRLDVTIAEHLAAGHSTPLIERMKRMMSLLDRTSGVVRQMVISLRPAALDLGLLAGLEWLAADFSERTRIECKTELGGCTEALTEQRSTALFRIVQESLTNVARHADARRVAIVLQRSGDDCCLTIRDDGKGFDPAERGLNSFGLVGIRERAVALGGTARVTSAPGQGTTVEVRIPVSHA